MMIVAAVMLFVTSGWQDSPSKDELTQKIIHDGNAYLGYKYRASVDTGHIFDCSGFVSHVLYINGIEVSRSSASMAKEVEVIQIENTQPGDLLFFMGRDINSRHIGHVAMVVHKEGNSVFMIHATRRGIVVDEYKDDYYTRRFALAGRLPKLALRCLYDEQASENKPHEESNSLKIWTSESLLEYWFYCSKQGSIHFFCGDS